MRNPRAVARAGTALLLGTLLVGAAAIGPAGPAGAYTLQKNSDCGNTGQNDLKFAGPDVTMVLHYGELNGDATQQLQMVVAVGQVVDQFNEIGGTTAHISVVQLSTDPFTYQTWYRDTSPTI